MSKRIKIFRGLCYLLFTSIAAFWFVDNYTAGYTNWLMAGFMVLFVTQFLLDIKYIDKAIGIIMATGCFYMLIAVSSHLPKVEKVTSQTIKFFSFGYSIFGLGFSAALFLIYYHYAKRRIQELQTGVN